MTNNLSSRFIDTSQWETVKELELADPDFNKASLIDLLIGVSHYEYIMIGNIRLKEPNCGCIGYQCSLGSLLEGNRQSKPIQTISRLSLFLQRFWEREEVTAVQLGTAEEKRCDDYFKLTTRRGSPECRLLVKLLFRLER